MAFSAKYRRLTPASCVSATIMAAFIGGSLWAQSRLNPSTSTLTTYEADPTALQLVRPLVEQRVMGLGGTIVAASSSGGANSVTADGGPIADDKGGNHGDPGGGGDCSPGIPWYDTKESNSGGGGIFSGVQLHTGIYADLRTHMHLPQPGADWVISVDHNPRQLSTGGSYVDSDGFQGVNRFQGSAMELQAETDPPTNIYLVSGANRYQEFALADGTTLFKAVNGGYRGAKHIVDGGGPDLVEVYDVYGNTYVFFGFDTQSGVVKGQLWKISDANGNTSYVGHATNASTAKTDGYDATTGRILKAYDSADRRYTYTYTNDLLTEVKAETKTGGTWASPTGLTTVGKVNYTYYTNETYGDPGDLKMVKITTPLTDTGAELVTKTLYRYYEGPFNATSNPGYPHQIKYIYESEGLRQFDWAGDSTFDEDFLTASENDLKPYASAFFKYEEDDSGNRKRKRIIEAWFNGSCGCSGGSGSGTYVFRYDENLASPNGSWDPSSGYDTEWHSRTIVQEPTIGGTNTVRWVTTYFDEVGQALARVITEEDPANEPARFWATVYDREWANPNEALSGHIEFMHSPANVQYYDHNDDGDDGDATNSEPDNILFGFYTGTGLVTQYNRHTSGDYQGLATHVKYKEGTGGTAYLQRSLFYDRTTETKADGGYSITLARPVVDAHTVYTLQTATADQGPGNSPPSGAHRTEMTYDFYDDGAENAPLVTEDITTTYPTVSTGNNGSNSATSTRQHFRKDGRVSFAKAADGIITYYEYTNGQVTKVLQDADTTQDGGGGEQTDFQSVTIPSGFATDSPSASFHMRRTMTYDRAGRLEKTTASKSKSATTEDESLTYVSKLADDRIIILHYPKFDTGEYYGPISLNVINHAGSTEVSGIIALADNGGEYTTDAQTTHVTETSADPIVTVSNIGSLKRMSVQVHNKTGSRVDESRTYFLTPASGAGFEETNYDTTLFGYDAAGRPWRVKDPTGTIRRTIHDAIGRVTEQWIGTNDNSASFPGGESSGTANMVKTLAMVYDAGAAKANGHITKRTRFVVDSTTDQRETNYAYDFRGRMLLQTNPTAPHVFNKYDDAGRLIASGHFSSTANIVVGTDDPTTETSNRLALSDTSYDERGLVWRTKRFEINQTTGAIVQVLGVDQYLEELTWYDATGRVIKVDGGQLTKAFYDRLGRTTHQFILASINDSAYSDADDVSGDIVLQQNDTVYDRDSGLPLMTATIERHHDDLSSGTTGALDTNADGDPLLYTASDIEGRVQINASWYDGLHRLQDVVLYGTNGGSNFDRDGLTVPARSDAELRTTYAYNADGTTLSITDPKDLVTRSTYDDAGRQIVVINNYVNGTPSGPTGDDDVHTRYSFTDGMKTKMHVDIDGDGVEDVPGEQITTWVFGVSKGTNPGDSKIAAGHLLNKVVYPEQSGSQPEADRRVSYAYNAQGQTIWTKDQTGNVIENDYDASGRQTHRRVTTLGNDFDNAVLRISTTYDGLGRRQLVTQYNNATVGSGSITDEVKFTYDGSGNLIGFTQDKDSAVVSSGGNDYAIAYTYERAGSGAQNGRNTFRRVRLTLPDKAKVQYNYSSTGGLHDAWSSRVTSMVHTAADPDPMDLTVPSPVTIVEYKYNGVGSVVGTDYLESDLFLHRYSGGAYGDLDRFNRVTGDKWYKDLATTDRAIFDVSIAYDRNSNIIRTEDNIYPAGKDVTYTMDNLNRLTDAQWGTWGGSSIGSEVRQRTWTLDQLGNWDFDKLDLNNDNIYTGAGEYNEDRTHNDPNELLGRDTDDNGTDNYTLTYNKRGDMTNDGVYIFVYDAFGRLRQVKRSDNQNLVSEYWYGPLGFRRALKYDTDGDGDMDANDKTFHIAYNERWCPLSLFRDSDTAPKEQFVYHTAGADGYGSSSYIDAVAMRVKDVTAGWTGAADATLEVREYYCQNWRADVVAMITDSGEQIEQVRFDPYGRSFAMRAGDADGDSDIDNGDTVDTDQIQTWVNGGAGSYDVRGDLDLDGDVDAADKAGAGGRAGTILGWGKLSAGGAAGGNRKGYAGYEFDPVLAHSIWHVRHRVLNSDFGRWKTRDPIGYRAGLNLYGYVRARPLSQRDPLGLQDNQSPGSATPQPPLPPPWPTNYPSPESYQGECKPKKIAGPAFHRDRDEDEGGFPGFYRWSMSLSSSVWATDNSLITDNGAYLEVQYFTLFGSIWEPWTTGTLALTTSHAEFVIIFCHGNSPLYAKFGQPTDVASNESSSLRSDISIGASDAQATNSLTLAVNTAAADESNAEINIGNDTIGITYSGAGTVLSLDLGSYTWKCECPCDEQSTTP